MKLRFLKSKFKPDSIDQENRVVHDVLLKRIGVRKNSNGLAVNEGKLNLLGRG